MMWGRSSAGIAGGLVAAVLIGGVVAAAIGYPAEEALWIGGMVAVVTWAVLISAAFAFANGLRAWCAMACLALLALMLRVFQG